MVLGSFEVFWVLIEAVLGSFGVIWGSFGVIGVILGGDIGVFWGFLG